MSLENTGDKERKNQIETLKSKKEVLLLKQRRKEVLARKRGLGINENRKAELIKLRNEIIHDSSINKQLSLKRLEVLERQSNTLSETEFQNRLSKVIEKNLQYILYMKDKTTISIIKGNCLDKPLSFNFFY